MSYSSAFLFLYYFHLIEEYSVISSYVIVFLQVVSSINYKQSVKYMPKILKKYNLSSTRKVTFRCFVVILV